MVWTRPGEVVHWCRFYVRRSLRSFPLYYLVVLGGVAVGLDSARENWGSLLSYTLNLKMANQGWFVNNYAHFWSLSVEEQYYLIWPWVVLFAPEAMLIASSVAMLAIPLAFRFWYIASGYMAFNGLATYIHTAFCLDTLAVGAILAILEHSVPERIWVKWLHIVSAGAFLALAFLYVGSPSPAIGMMVTDLMSALVLGWVVFRAAKGFPGWLGVFLESGPVLYVGRISYGLYVYHPFVIEFIHARLPQLGRGATFLVSAAATLAVTSLSWFLFERPLNNLKDRIRIGRASGRTAPQPAA